MNQKISKKHHYLPVHYLEGFTDSNIIFFVYDKKMDKIFPTNPNGVFFENNLNTITLPNGVETDFLENLYTEFENQSWSTLNKIRKSTNKTPIELLDKMYLYSFLLFLYWRLPANIEFAYNLSEKAFAEKGEFDFLKLNSKNGEKAPQEITDAIKNSRAFKKSFKQIIPFVPFYKDKDWAKRVEKWRFLYTGDSKSWYIVGDNPFIIKQENERDFVNCLNEFVCPISGNILLISTVEEPAKTVLPPEFAIDYNTAIIERAQRFVACPDKSFLEALIRFYKFQVKYGKTNLIIPEMFKTINQV
jgi:Protein of unknown function (DUF4238)